MKRSTEYLSFLSLHVLTSPLMATQCHALLASQAAGWRVDYVRLQRNVVHIYCVPLRKGSPVFRGVLTQQDSCTVLRGRLTFIDVENVGFVILIAFFALFTFGFVFSVIRDLGEAGPAPLGKYPLCDCATCRSCSVGQSRHSLGLQSGSLGGNANESVSLLRSRSFEFCDRNRAKTRGAVWIIKSSRQDLGAGDL